MDERTMLRYVDELQGQIDRLKKMIGGGGGGSVVINPEGAATSDLEKIKSGDTIYGLNYNKNANRPQVNGNLLTGNKNSKQLNIAENITEAEYAALSSKNENEIYFLQEKASIVTETEDGFTITWESYSDPAYVATLSYTPSDQDVTGITSVTCDTDTIEIVTFELNHGDVSVTIGCEDPSEVPEAVEFTFTFTQPAGSTRIVKNGLQFGVTMTELFSGTEYAATCDLSDHYNNYDLILFVARYSGQTAGDHRITTLVPAALFDDTDFTIQGHGWYVEVTSVDSDTVGIASREDGYLSKVYGIRF